MPTKCVQNLLGHDVAEQGRSLQAQLCHASFIVSPNPRGLGEDCVKTAADAESLDRTADVSETAGKTLLRIFQPRLCGVSLL